MRWAWWRTSSGWLLALATTGCTHQTHVLAGPAVAYPAGKPTYGGALVLGHGDGASQKKDETFHTFGPSARVLVTEESQHVRVGGTVQVAKWLGRVLFDASAPLGMGVERFERTGYFTMGGGLSLRLGYPLTDSTHLAPTWLAPEEGTPRVSRLERRERTVLLLGPAADVDFRFTREPLPSVSLVVGVMFVEEYLPRDRPPLRPFGLHF